MNPVSVAMVAASGYGAHYLRMMFAPETDRSAFTLKGVIDPFVKNSPCYDQITAEKIPTYDTLEEFFAGNTAELVIISSPLKFHKEQILIALKHGCHVLCEKPLVTTINTIDEIRQAVAASGKKLGVGFQWSYSPPLLAFKQDILDGVFGKPVLFKSFTSWKRYDDYYSNGWKGCIRDSKGDLVLDSVATNATAHYLHNIFFMLGGAIDTSAMPVTVTGELYRGKEIESYDTCFLKGKFESGCEFQYIATHAAEAERNPCFSYAFENAVVEFNMPEGNTEIVARFHDGRVKKYGNPNGREYGEPKFKTMLKAVRGDEVIPCKIDTIIPHLKVCDALFDKVDIHNFPKDLWFRGDSPDGKVKGSFIHGLLDQAWACFEQNKMPAEMGYSWAVAQDPIDIQAYQEFTGCKIAK